MLMARCFDFGKLLSVFSLIALLSSAVSYAQIEEEPLGFYKSRRATAILQAVPRIGKCSITANMQRDENLQQNIINVSIKTDTGAAFNARYFIGDHNQGDYHSNAYGGEIYERGSAFSEKRTLTMDQNYRGGSLYRITINLDVRSRATRVRAQLWDVKNQGSIFHSRSLTTDITCP